MAEDKSVIWQDAYVEELVFRSIALKRKYELAQEYDHYAELAAAEKKETPDLDAKIRVMSNRYVNQEKRSCYLKFLRKGLSVAMILVVVLMACSMIAFAVSPAFRETVLQYIMVWEEDYVEIKTEVADGGEELVIAYYMPTWVPDGFILTEQISEPAFSMFYYEIEDWYISLTISTVDTVTNLDTDRTIIERDFKINGQDAIVGYEENILLLLWNNGVASFNLYTNLPLADAQKFAENIIYIK